MIHCTHIEQDLIRIRQNSPLIHNITNYVVMNNTANALLAIGASPVMAHAVEEVADMVKIASAVVLNIGTLNEEWVEAMLIAGQTALVNNKPLIFDPVGAGATPYRNNVCRQIIERCKPDIIRGNASEIMALCHVHTQTKGVDSTDSSHAALDSAKQLARQTGAVVVISGQTDYITDGEQVETVQNGNTMMACVTGMGCTATAVVAAFAAVNKNMLEAATHGMALMGIAGEIAAARSAGNGSLQLHFLDELYSMQIETIRKHLKV
ncbi:hydroxyethylthiazole kinase [Parabacteroides sp. 52]|uniref:hydroxyethylthiazole kinase n=1 Tax=unclassified Parabacteroides TaxID=2649774 RepID=UPI0013D09135|nr:MULTISPECIES: hydroxyethylthiazole kinase [unclassified Parabacteroides]MDH6535009.1 hydroxyethylthiazole kinase [Parabacteroides sp. PM5-20]NDV55269.1 hydroxyethylthiazole kinase [Parabacteroides sp. 52]